MKVKICGLTNLADAQAAAESGADLLGFIFAESPRRVEEDKVTAIINNLSIEVDIVGVFVNRDLAEVNRISENCSLDFVQLHGEESSDYCNQISRPVIKAFRVKDKSYLDQLKKYEVDKYLLDTYVSDKRGGTGKTFNWELAGKAKEYGEVFIAGGLTPDNVEEAVSVVEPAGVDISSGVEIEPGKKDCEQVRKIVDKIK